MIDSLIKQQTAWSQGSSKYQKETIILQIQIKKKRKMATILKLAITNIYPNYQHYTDIDRSVNT